MPLAPRNYPDYWGLAILVMRCAQIAAILLEEGYLLNGAINIGSIEHTGRNIVGKAYQDSYLMQSSVCSPAIVLCPDAIAAWRTLGLSPLYLPRSVVFKGKDAKGTATREEREVEIVNMFEPKYMNSVRSIAANGPSPVMNDAWLTGCIDRIEATVAENIARFGHGTPTHNPAVLAKWAWLQALFRDKGKPGIEEHYSVRPEQIKWTAP